MTTTQMTIRSLFSCSNGKHCSSPVGYTIRTGFGSPVGYTFRTSFGAAVDQNGGGASINFLA